MANPQQAAATADRRPFRLVAIICASGLALSMFDQSAVTTALAAIRADLDIEVAALQWVTTLLPLMAAVTLPVSGTLGDLWGARATMQTGLLVFGLGATIALLATDLRLLLIARAIQGVGVAFMLPNGAALLGHNIGDHPRRASAFGFWLMVSTTGLVLGPLAGGALSQTVGWRLTFAVMAPIALLGAVGLWRLKDTPRRWSGSVDLAGLLTASAGLGLLCWALIEAGRAYAPLWPVGLAVLGAALAFSLFVMVEKRVRQPIIELALLRNRQFTAVLGAALLYNLATGGGVFLLSLYFQDQRGLSPFVAGALLLAATIGMPLAGQLAGPLARRRPVPVIMTGSAAAMAVAYVTLGLIAFLPVPALILPLLFIGLTCGLLYSFDTQAVLERVPPDRSASALATLALMRQVGGVLGIAVLGSLAQVSGQIQRMSGERVALVATGLLLVPAAAWLWWARPRRGSLPTQRTPSGGPRERPGGQGGQRPLTADLPSDTV